MANRCNRRQARLRPRRLKMKHMAGNARNVRDSRMPGRIRICPNLEVLAMSKFTKWLGVAALGVGMTTATGCVSNKEFKQVKLERDEAIQQRDQLQTESEAARAEADSYKNQLGAMSDSHSEEVQNLSRSEERRVGNER